LSPAISDEDWQKGDAVEIGGKKGRKGKHVSVGEKEDEKQDRERNILPEISDEEWQKGNAVKKCEKKGKRGNKIPELKLMLFRMSTEGEKEHESEAAFKKKGKKRGGRS
jgi:hypothetical protein